jgi:hypothetical protein
MALLVAGCTTSYAPSEADLKAQWESQNVPPVNYKSDIIAFMRTYLNDPTMVRGASVSPPQRKTVANDPAERYVSCLRYDAHKSGGGYAGMKTGVVVYVSGKLDHFIDAPRVAQDTCKDAAYEPFPELQSMTR